MSKTPSILLIYTGGTIGMMRNPDDGHLMPLNFEPLLQQLPELAGLEASIDVESTNPPIDSSDISPDHWLNLAKIIQSRYHAYDGFVILHGTDTLSYTGSALSFIFENLNKAVVLTGSQLPINEIRTDARENIITAIEVAAAHKDGKPLVPEVSIYFEYKLYRANRSMKFSSHQFEAFRSVNYPLLAKAGTNIDYNEMHILPYKSDTQNLKIAGQLDTSVSILRLFPGINFETLEHIAKGTTVKIIILESYGAGNAPASKELISFLQLAAENDKVVLNISQCPGGRVEMGRYKSSRQLIDNGVISGSDMTIESAITKSMYLLGITKTDTSWLKQNLSKSLRGEME